MNVNCVGCTKMVLSCSVKNPCLLEVPAQVFMDGMTPGVCFKNHHETKFSGEAQVIEQCWHVSCNSWVRVYTMLSTLF